MARVPFGIFEGGAKSGGYTTSEATVSHITKKVGDAVTKGEVIAVIETNKAKVDICIPVSGIVAELFFTATDEWNKTGEEKTENDVLFLPALGTIETEEIQEHRQESALVERALPSEKVEEVSAVVIPLTEETISTEKTPISERPKSRDWERTSSPIPRASPAARCLARTHDIDLSSIEGTGPRGIIQVSDVEIAIGKISLPVAPSSPTPVKVHEQDPGIRVLSPSRESRTLALNLEKGSRSVVAGGEMECLLPWWNPMQKYGKTLFKEFAGVPFRSWALIAYAAVHILRKRKFWLLNGSWKEEEDRTKDTVNLHTSVHMGISYDSGELATIHEEKGTISGSRLKILTIRDAHALSLTGFMVSLDELLVRAKEGKTTMHDLSGHTFIVNNIGALGFKRGQSLLTPGISGLLNLGRVDEAGETVIGLFFDHRMCDGRLAGRFLLEVIEEANKIVLG